MIRWVGTYDIMRNMAKARSKGTVKRGRPAGSKNTRGRKKAAPAHELPGGFWRQIVAILLALVAVFLVLTWMGDGGETLNLVDGFLSDAIGRAKFFVPVLLVWMAFKIFRSEGNRLAPVVWIASILMVCWLAGAFGLSGEANGGAVGAWLNEFVTELLDPSVAVIIYIILIFVTAAFILQMSPAAVVETIADWFRTTETKEVRAKAKKVEPVKKEKKDVKAVAKAGDVEIEVRGAAAEEEPLKPQPKLGMFGKLGLGKKKDAEVEAAPAKVETKEVTENNKALVAVSDPDWKMPSIELFERKQSKADSGDVQQNASIIQSTLADFGIDVEMGPANVGPRVTQYTMKAPNGVSLSKILARDKELQLNLAVETVRIEAPIPGTRLVGVEVPNVKSADVRLRGVLESPEWRKTDAPLSFAVGRDISGKAVVENLAKMPHLLIAGTTGSGKSVMTNTLLSSLLYRNAPSDLKLIIIDPKQVEMAEYEDIPHLLTPIITSPEKAISALRWAVTEMERRYTLMAEEKVKNIIDYNAKMAKLAAEENLEKGKKVKKDAEAPEAEMDGEVSQEMSHEGERMPYIVILVDEMSDIMMVAGKELEMPIVRIAQKGRAAGIHLVLATQRPEVKVITGLIKANIPGRIAFAVQNQVDSRVILDMVGADKLLGMGDMLLLTTSMMGKPRRIQGAWANDDDVKHLTDFLRAQRPPQYNDEVVSQTVQIKGMSDGGDIGGLGDLGRRYDPNDPVVRKAIEITLKQGKFSTASLQTWLGKGHGFVSGLAIWLEEIGVIGPANGHKPREVLIRTMEEFEEKAGQ